MTIASNPPIDLPIEKLTMRQKWDLYAVLRDELEPNKEFEIPDWHLEILEEREQMFARGEVEVLSLDEVVKKLEAKFP